MTVTIAYAARLRFAKATTPLARLMRNAQFDAIIAGNDFGAVIIDAAEHDFEFTCEWNGHGTDVTFARIDNRDGFEIRVCEFHADHADVSYVAD